MLNRRALLAAPLAALVPGATRARDSRSFHLGTSRWPPAATFEALAMVDAFLRDHCDMASPMVLGGVPWTEAANNTDFSTALMEELQWAAPSGHPVCLSLGALDTLRQNLAPWYADQDNQPLPPEFDGRAFDDPRVIDAYGAFCVRAAQTMKPDWLIIGVEVNILLHSSPDKWPAYVALHQATVARLRRDLPEQKIGISIAALHYLGLSDGADAGVQAREMRALAGSVDLVGWSVYPHTSWDVHFPIAPEFYDFITQFAADTGTRAAVTESGMTARRVWINWVPLWGSPEGQAQVMAALLEAASRGGWEFVVNWASHDYPDLLELFPPDVRELGEIWVWTGLRDPKGQDKPVMALWDQALARAFVR